MSESPGDVLDALRVAAAFVGTHLGPSDRQAMVMAHPCMRGAHALERFHKLRLNKDDVCGAEDGIKRSMDQKSRSLSRLMPALKYLEVVLPKHIASDGAWEPRVCTVAACLRSCFPSTSPGGKLELVIGDAHACTACLAALPSLLSEGKAIIISLKDLQGSDSTYLDAATALFRAVVGSGGAAKFHKISIESESHSVCEALAACAHSLGDHLSVLTVKNYDRSQRREPLSDAALRALSTVKMVKVTVTSCRSCNDERMDLVTHATHVRDDTYLTLSKMTKNHVRSYGACERIYQMHICDITGDNGTSWGSATLADCVLVPAPYVDANVIFCSNSVNDPSIVWVAAAVLRRLAQYDPDVRCRKTLGFEADDAHDAQPLCARLAYLQVLAVARRERLEQPTFHACSKTARDRKWAHIDRLSYDDALYALERCSPFLHAAWAMLRPPQSFDGVKNITAYS